MVFSKLIIQKSDFTNPLFNLFSGEYVGDFIVNLYANYSANISTFHLIGHSLGAHIAGFAGKQVQNRTGVNVGRITGLDPAGPLYRLTNEDDRLGRGDADLVVALHTDAGFNGYPDPLADIDFYANSGYPNQPGCFDFIDSRFSFYIKIPI